MQTKLIAMALLLGVVFGTGAQELPKGMKQYFFAFLVKGEKWDQRPPKAELDALQQKHLAYIQTQADAGRYKVAGPFLDDGRIRGMLLIDAPTADEARRIAGADPMVQSGRMAVELHPVLMADAACIMVDYNRNSGK